MKKTLLIAFIGLTSIAFSQKGNTSSAGIAYKNYQANKAEGNMEDAGKELLDAKNFIDQSYVHEDTKDDPKTLMYYGMIYVEIGLYSTILESIELQEVSAEEALEKGFEALKKSKELDEKERYVEDVNLYCRSYYALWRQQGSIMFDEGKYAEAMMMLLGSATFGDAGGIQDSAAYFYGGLAAFKIDSFRIAEEAFQQTVDWGYQPGYSVYYLSQAMQKQGKMSEAENMLKEQVSKYPGDKDILIELINLYIDTDRKEDAITFLNEARKLDPDNIQLTFTAGTIYENMGEFEKADQAYKEVLATDKDHVDALAALGGLYYNKGADVNNEANKLEFGDPNFDKMVAESKEYFKQSVDYFERANALSPEDVDIMTALRDAYGKAGMTDKYIEMKEKIESMKAGQ